MSLKKLTQMMRTGRNRYSSNCNTLQHTAIHCNTLQHTATQSAIRCNSLQHTATHCNTLRHTSTHSNTLPHVAPHTATRCTAHCNKLHRALRCTATHYKTQQQTTICCNGLSLEGLRTWVRFASSRCATHSNTLQHTAIHCNTLQHTATHRDALQHTTIYCNSLSLKRMTKLMRTGIIRWLRLVGSLKL